MRQRRFVSGLVALSLGLTPANAPGAPGVDQQYLPADKAGFLTARSSASTVWATVQRSGGLGEIFYPTVDAPAARGLTFVVADGHGHAWPATATSTSPTLDFRQAFRGPGWRLSASYTTDPAQNTVLVDVRVSGPVTAYVIFDPALANSRGGDAGRTEGDALTATDGGMSSALMASPGFRATSSGFAGISDGRTDLLADGRMDWHYRSSSAGSLVQTGQIGRHATLALAFGASASAALDTARGSLRAGFPRIQRAYAYGWNRYLSALKPPPSVLKTSSERRLYRMSTMVLAASEDKTHPGAFVAAPAAPWAFGQDDPSGPYHLVWSRDLYQIATGLLAAGDVSGASRALSFLFGVQQKADGSFPQNSRVDGTPVWGGLQLDEVALPIVLAYQLGRRDASTWAHVRRAADFLVNYPPAPLTPQDRWENQSGYSPGTIAASIAGLVCASTIAAANGDAAAARRYLSTADNWRARVKEWTVTTNGPYSPRPYFLRLTKDGHPDLGTTYAIGDSGPSAMDQRKVVDPSFLELVRLGVLPARDRDIVNSLSVVDRQLGVATPNGFYWHRASFDGYGEQADGSQWEYDEPPDSMVSRGRAWPLLNGERGEWALAAGDSSTAARQLAAMAAAAGPGDMLPEQVWDQAGPAPGRPTFSATPLAWTHAQFIRLAWDLQAGRVVEQPAAVAARYLPRG
ncbi:glycoside hydrolase family 15 protein [Actinoplanes sp. NPDC051343]|uniref:glycoside hydrolase family 15 protein n=1 Tax=Actinoplanes sp. NPDC051343 TaxID=3363906 RepID=UPI0037A3AEBD